MRVHHAAALSSSSAGLNKLYVDAYSSFPLLATALRSGANIAGPIDGLWGGNCALQRLGRIIITIYIDGLTARPPLILGLFLEKKIPLISTVVEVVAAARVALLLLSSFSTFFIVIIYILLLLPTGYVGDRLHMQHAVRTALTFEKMRVHAAR